jgi:hypothetical protein
MNSVSVSEYYFTYLLFIVHSLKYELIDIYDWPTFVLLQNQILILHRVFSTYGGRERPNLIKSRTRYIEFEGRYIDFQTRYIDFHT